MVSQAVIAIGLIAVWVVLYSVVIEAQPNDRNLGTGSKLGIPRGMNQLWNLGGIQYAPPIR